MIASIKGKTKKELQKIANQKLVNCRIWLQEHGERALGIGFLVGIFAILATKLVVALLVISLVGSLVIWQLAPEESASETSAKDESEFSATEASEENHNGHPEVDPSRSSENHSSH
jgi:hypothetical protein